MAEWRPIMKKAFVEMILTGIIITASLAGCGNSKTGETSQNSGALAQEEADTVASDSSKETAAADVEVADSNEKTAETELSSGADAGTEKSVDESAAEASKVAKSDEKDIAYEDVLDEVVSDAIISRNEDMYGNGDFECAGEGHIIFGETRKEAGDGYEQQVDCKVIYSQYGFQDGNLVVTAGCGVIPTHLVFDVSADGEFMLKDYVEPEDGSRYEESVKEIFPEDLWDTFLTNNEEDDDNLREQDRQYASDYLAEIGREAKIGDYGDFERVFLADKGVSVDVSNQMIEKEKLSVYPYWLGNLERVEDGVRYTYSVSLDTAKKEIVYEKTNTDSGESVEKFVFDSETGEEIK
jgi:hypothetical protein